MKGVDNELDWYKISQAEGFGAKSLHYLWEISKTKKISINDVFELNKKEFYFSFPDLGTGKFSKATFESFHQKKEDVLLREYEALKKANITIIGIGDKLYPQLVRERMKDSAPFVLFCKGNLKLLTAKNIAVIGSRTIKDVGLEKGQEIGSELALAGYNVVSGYAKGIDRQAHLGALKQDGTTTMVLGYGLNELAVVKEFEGSDLEKNALFVSQFTPDAAFSGQNAMIRNKLLCAFSTAVVVIASDAEINKEGKNSGTFDAGISAIKMDIPLYVLSTSLFGKKKPEGNDELIDKGGTEFTEINEVLQELQENEPEEEVTENKKQTLIQQQLF